MVQLEPDQSETPRYEKSPLIPCRCHPGNWCCASCLDDDIKEQIATDIKGG